MHVLLIGYSKIVQNRILPALTQIPLIRSIDIASRTSASKIALPSQFKGEIFDDYEEALSKSKAKLVYVSLVNSAHAEWVEKSLLKGFHVIVDKPSFSDIKDAIRLIELSKKMDLCLAEATVYAYHQQIQLIKDIFLKANSKPLRLTAAFSFPPLNADNFRCKKELGGGSLWDLGVYAVSPGRIFFNEAPKEVFCRIYTRNPENNLDTSFVALATYSEGRSFIGHFGFDTEYRNCLNILGPDVSVDIERIFSTPAELENEIKIRQQNRAAILKAPKADSFVLFLQEVIKAIQVKGYGIFRQDLIDDATSLHRLLVSSQEGY